MSDKKYFFDRVIDFSNDAEVVELSNDSSFFITYFEEYNDVIAMYDFKTFELIEDSYVPFSVNDISISDDDKYFSFCYDNPDSSTDGFYIAELETLEVVYSDFEDETCQCCDWSNGLVAVGKGDDIVIIDVSDEDPDNWGEIADSPLEFHSQDVGDVKFSEDGSLIGSTSIDGIYINETSDWTEEYSKTDVLGGMYIDFDYDVDYSVYTYYTEQEQPYTDVIELDNYTVETDFEFISGICVWDGDYINILDPHVNNELYIIPTIDDDPDNWDIEQTFDDAYISYNDISAKNGNTIISATDEHLYTYNLFDYNITNWHELDYIRQDVESTYDVVNTITSESDGYDYRHDELDYRGSWSTTEYYYRGDLVINNADYYYCTKYHRSTSTDEPGEGADYEDYWVYSTDFTDDDDGKKIGFLPIDDFTGTLEGNDNRINNLKIDRPDEDNVSLFGEIDASCDIKNIKFNDVNIVGNDYVGGIVGNGSSHTDIDNCRVQGLVKGDTNVGGIVGFIGSSGDIKDSDTDINVQGNNEVGGIVGDYNSDIERCSSKGTVSGIGTNPILIGGLIGTLGSATSSIGENCYSTCNVSGNNYVGGLVGANYGNGILENTYATGYVDCPNEVKGGLVAYNSGEVKDSMSLKSEYYGEFYKNIGSEEGTQTGRVTRASSDVMKDIKLYTEDGFEDYEELDEAWDIETIENWDGEIWNIEEGKDYPKLGTPPPKPYEKDTEISYHKERLLGNLPNFYATHHLRGSEFPLTLPFTLSGRKTNLNKWAEVIGNELDEILSTLLDIRNIKFIDGAEGTHLDKLAELFGLERLEGESDALFRNRITNYLHNYVGGGSKEQLSNVVEWFIEDYFDNKGEEPDEELSYYYKLGDGYQSYEEFDAYEFPHINVENHYIEVEDPEGLSGFDEYMEIYLELKPNSGNEFNEQFIYKQSGETKIGIKILDEDRLSLRLTKGGIISTTTIDNELVKEEFNEFKVIIEKFVKNKYMIKTYINGELIYMVFTEDNWFDFPPNADGDVIIGDDTTDNNFFGVIRNVKIYGDNKELVAYWRIDEGEGTDIVDYSGYGNTGVATSDHYWDTFSMFYGANFKINLYEDFEDDPDFNEEMLISEIDNYRAYGVKFDGVNYGDFTLTIEDITGSGTVYVDGDEVTSYPFEKTYEFGETAKLVGEDSDDFIEWQGLEEETPEYDNSDIDLYMHKDMVITEASFDEG